MNNYIPDNPKEEAIDRNELDMRENEIIIPKGAVPNGAQGDISNKISMASTANGSILERTEVLAGNPPFEGKKYGTAIKWEDRKLFGL